MNKRRTIKHEDKYNNGSEISDDYVSPRKHATLYDTEEVRRVIIKYAL